MADNEQVLLDQVLVQRQAERSVPIRDDEAFELFAAEQALATRQLSAEEVAEGVIGGSNDGAIDAIYVFVDGMLLSEDSDVLQAGFSSSKLPRGVKLQLWLVQAKRETSFTETAIDKAAAALARLLSLAENEDDLLKLYSSGTVSRTGFFRKALRALATRHPQVEIHFVYATRGRANGQNSINTKVEIKARDLETQLASVISGAKGHVEFLGAAELWRRANTVASYTTELTYQENATSGNSHVALVKLRDYMIFLKDEDGQLRRHIFDWNVRDYQGDVEVNREIRASLEDPEGPEFWWLNNGVTIVCSKATAVGKTYSLDDVQVVNGLQSSHTIFNFLRTASESHPALDRSVLVRILVTGDDLATRDLVIRATNRQTSVPAASLRATDNIQRDIEAYFLGHDWYYDRRKNFYRNSGRSAERIVSISLLAQAVMAMGLSRPDNSRARPSSLLKRDEEYKRIFSKDIPVEIYLWVAQAQKEIDAFLASETAGVSVPERNNYRFHLAMVATAKLVGQPVRSPKQLSRLASAGTPLADADLPATLAFLRGEFAVHERRTGNSLDKIAKGPDFVEHLLGISHDRTTKGPDFVERLLKRFS
ncbi:AIPR family protein [Micromonospora lupini]|uniref:AIPR family protein n=1 Tax=Micromonospora lupini TaxID=285679 RepID=UPI00225015FC|nr:AIPR family protein [Micromonospora lupini]MCX5068223.1 AIPR family protein [Micromonospora lupini]